MLFKIHSTKSTDMATQKETRLAKWQSHMPVLFPSGSSGTWKVPAHRMHTDGAEILSTENNQCHLSVWSFVLYLGYSWAVGTCWLRNPTLGGGHLLGPGKNDVHGLLYPFAVVSLDVASKVSSYGISCLKFCSDVQSNIWKPGLCG